MRRCAQCGSDIDTEAQDETGEPDYTVRRHRQKTLFFCDAECEADYFTPSDEPIDWDEQDRRAAEEERIEMWRNEY